MGIRVSMKLARQLTRQVLWWTIRDAVSNEVESAADSWVCPLTFTHPPWHLLGTQHTPVCVMRMMCHLLTGKMCCSYQWPCYSYSCAIQSNAPYCKIIIMCVHQEGEEELGPRRVLSPWWKLLEPCLAHGPEPANLSRSQRLSHCPSPTQHLSSPCGCTSRSWIAEGSQRLAALFSSPHVFCTYQMEVCNFHNWMQQSPALWICNVVFRCVVKPIHAPCIDFIKPLKGQLCCEHYQVSHYRTWLL